jgi:N-acetylglucosamine-6-phosphate deacetylase
MINYLKNTKTIAGSAMPFNQIVKNYGTLTKCSMQEILKVSSLNAARSLKLDKQIGTISPNANSSFVLIDKQYNLKHVFINGKKIK